MITPVNKNGLKNLVNEIKSNCEKNSLIITGNREILNSLGDVNGLDLVFDVEELKRKIN